MVIEDEPTVGRLIADVLEDKGLHVDVLLDGREALDRAGRERFDLVICDMKMPGLDGQNFYQSLARAESASGAIPFCDRRRNCPANPGIFGAKPAASRGQAVPRREAGGEGIQSSGRPARARRARCGGQESSLSPLGNSKKWKVT
jgi:hypothetical protein